MILELLAAAIMLRRVMVDDAFVSAVSRPQPDGTPTYARMVRGAAFSIVTGFVPPIVALCLFPTILGLPLAAFSLAVVTCDWLLSFCGARVKTGQSHVGMSFSRIPPHKRIVMWETAVSFASFVTACVFIWAAFFTSF